MTFSLPPVPRKGRDFKIHTIQELQQRNGDVKSSINETIRLTQESRTIVQGASKQLAQLEESQRDLRYEVKNTADQIQHTCAQTKGLNQRIADITAQIRAELQEPSPAPINYEPLFEGVARVSNLLDQREKKEKFLLKFLCVAFAVACIAFILIFKKKF